MRPVAPSVEGGRIVFGANQVEYEPLPAAITREGVVVTDWEPSAEDLATLMEGGRVRISILTFGDKLQPLKVEAAR